MCQNASGEGDWTLTPLLMHALPPLPSHLLSPFRSHTFTGPLESAYGRGLGGGRRLMIEVSLYTGCTCVLRYGLTKCSNAACYFPLLKPEEVGGRFPKVCSKGTGLEERGRAGAATREKGTTDPLGPLGSSSSQHRRTPEIVL